MSLFGLSFTVAQRQLSGVETHTDKGCAGIQLAASVSGCSGPMWYYSKATPRVTAKTVVPVKMLSGRAAVRTQKAMRMAH